MSRLADLPLRVKITALVAGLTLAALGAGFALLAGWEAGALRRATLEQARVQGRLAADSVAAQLAFGYREETERTLAALARLPDLELAAAYDADGRLFAAYPPSAAPPVRLEAPGEESSRITAGLAEVWTPVGMDGSRYGTLHLQVSLASLRRRARALALAAAGVAAIVGGLAALLAWPLAAAVSRPCLSLAELARRVTREGDWSLRAGRRGGDEVGVMAEAFDAMLDAVSSRDAALRELNESLERRVRERTAELEREEEEVRRLNRELGRRLAEVEAANRELESFSYSVSHDLRAPLRVIGGFCAALEERHTASLDPEARNLLGRVRARCLEMGQLIDNLLALSQLGRKALMIEEVDLSDLARRAAERLRASAPERKASLRVEPGLKARGDEPLLASVIDNLMGNAWKFTSRSPEAVIEFGALPGEGGPAYFVRDNGVGFDMAYAGQLFQPFRRLHSRDEYPGTGVGLAMAARIVGRHGGRIWAEGSPGRGATFYFTLGT